MYIDFNLSSSKKLELTAKIQQLFDETVTDEMVQELFLQSIKSCVKSVVTEICQSKKFKDQMFSKVESLMNERIVR